MSLQNFLMDFNLDDLFLLENSKEKKEFYEITSDECSVSTLVNLHNNSKLLFPSYFLRWGAFTSVSELDEKALNVLLEAGSVMAYKELKVRFGENLWKAPDEFLVIGAQRNGASEREILAYKYEQIIDKIINRVDKRFYFKGQEKEDLIQEAYMGFLKAIEVYKIERRTKFKDFSHYVIQRHLGTLMNRSKNYRNRALNDSFSYNMPVNGTNNDTTFEDLLEGANASPEKIIEDNTTFEEIYGKLTENEQEVYDYYSDGYTYEEIAFELLSGRRKNSEDTVPQICFDESNYEKVSNSIKLFDLYHAAIEHLHKSYSKNMAADLSNLVTEVIMDCVNSENENQENTPSLISSIESHLSELELDVVFESLKSTINVENVMEIVREPVMDLLHSNYMLEIIKDGLTYKDDKEYQKIPKKLLNAIDKVIFNAIYTFMSSNIHYTNHEIAEKVIELDYQITKDMTLEEVEGDIQEKFSYLNSEGLGWKEIAHEMKRKKKSVDNTIQRIRNKGHQHMEEFEELMKKEINK